MKNLLGVGVTDARKEKCDQTYLKSLDDANPLRNTTLPMRLPCSCLLEQLISNLVRGNWIHVVTYRPNRDREAPRGASPPTPPGIRVTYHGGSMD